MARSRLPLFARTRAVAAVSAVLLTGGPAAPATPAETPAPREALTEAMEPVIDLLSRDPAGSNRAMALHATVTDSNAQPPELIGAHLAMYLQPADKALFQFCALGSVMTVCRQGQTVWVAPADKLAPLLQQVEAKPPTKADKEPIAPVRLKVPTTLFWLLFRLVPVKEAGSGDLNGTACRKVDVKPPDGDDKNGYMRLWLRADNHMLARMEWHGTNSHSTITVDDLKFVPALPPGVFDPASVPPEARLAVPAERFRALMSLVGKQEEARRKKMLEAAKPAGDAAR